MARRILRKIFNNKSLYLYLVLQLATGLSILLFFLSSLITSQREYNAFIRDGRTTEYSIAVSLSEEGQGRAGIPVTAKNVGYIDETYGIKISLTLEKLIYCPQIFKSGDEKGYCAVYSNTNTEVNMSRGFYEMFSQDHSQIMNIRDFPFTLKGDMLYADSGEYRINITDETAVTASLPLEVYETSFQHEDVFPLKISFRYNNTDTKSMSQDMLQIISYLRSENKDYDYNIGSNFYSFLRRGYTLQRQSRLISMIFSLMMITVTIGISFTMTMLFRKRQREIAVCLVIGARKKRIATELFVEIGLVVLAGFFVTLTVYIAAVISGMRLEMLQIRFEPAAVLIILAMTVVQSAVAVLPSLIEIIHFMPMEILRDE